MRTCQERVVADAHCEPLVVQGLDSGSTEDKWALGTFLLLCYQCLDHVANLQQAISLLEAFVRSCSVSDGRYPPVLANLAVALMDWFLRLGNLGDLKQAISISNDAIDYTLAGNPFKPSLLNDLGNHYYI